MIDPMSPSPPDASPNGLHEYQKSKNASSGATDREVVPDVHAVRAPQPADPSPDHAAELKTSLSWAVYETCTMKSEGKRDFPVRRYYDPKTGARLKESTLPDGWSCSYGEAVEAAKRSE